MADLSKQILLELALNKLQDARLLRDHGSYGNAYYLAGYAVELALKAVIATRFVSNVLPDPGFVRRDLYVHDLNTLLAKAGVKAKFDSDAEDRPALLANWRLVANWSEDARYATADAKAAIDLIQAIEDPSDGVFGWVKKHL